MKLTFPALIKGYHACVDPALTPPEVYKESLYVSGALEREERGTRWAHTLSRRAQAKLVRLRPHPLLHLKGDRFTYTPLIRRRGGGEVCGKVHGGGLRGRGEAREAMLIEL
jgi:hypothetical protein